jgi:hypothetical protein
MDAVNRRISMKMMVKAVFVRPAVLFLILRCL